MSEPATPEKLITIGAYGKSATTFFDALIRAGVDLFCDIRQRRGVRGSEYAFVNSTRLQSKLAELGIAYRHVPDLAPTTEIRERQYAADQLQGVTKRARLELGQTFKELYTHNVLDHFNADAFRSSLGNARRVAFFCVEGAPAACHRSLVSERLHNEWAVPVQHL
ncbi:MAG: DUF488 family protein [Bryobacteraceae bacterium]